MKRLLALLCCLALALAAHPAIAEGETTNWKIREIQSGAREDFDGDETAESLIFEVSLDEYGDGDFAITVGENTFARENCMALDETVRAMGIGYGDYTYGTVFMVSEYGPSDDPYTYCFLYTDGALREIGEIPALAEHFEVDADGLIHTQIRAECLGTWSRPADYVLAFGVDWSGEETQYSYRLCEVPRDVYPMGYIAELKVDLPLLEDRLDAEAARSLRAGQQVILVSTDCKRWLYVASMDGRGGWVRIQRGEDSWQARVNINGTLLVEDEVFDHLLYAD